MSWPKSWILWFLPTLHLRINGYWLFVDTDCSVIEKIGCISWKSGLVSVTLRKKFSVFPSFEAMFVPSKSFRITFQCCPAFPVWEAWPPAFSESSEKKLAFHRKPKCLAISLRSRFENEKKNVASCVKQRRNLVNAVHANRFSKSEGAPSSEPFDFAAARSLGPFEDRTISVRAFFFSAQRLDVLSKNATALRVIGFISFYSPSEISQEPSSC